MALTRKNALLVASDGGAEHWAVIASLVDTRKLAGVEPRADLADVITRIVEGHPHSRLDDLLPWAYPTTPTAKAAWPENTTYPAGRAAQPDTQPPAARTAAWIP